MNNDFLGTDPPRPAILLRDIEGFKLPLPVFFVLLDFDRRSVYGLAAFYECGQCLGLGRGEALPFDLQMICPVKD